MARLKVDGGCHCGKISYAAEVNPDKVVICHCTDCQTISGAPYRANVPALVETFSMAGEPNIYVKVGSSGARIATAFCGECGSPIYYRTNRRPDVIDLYAGTLSDPSALVPQCHVHAVEQLPWFEVLDDLPRYPGSQRTEEPIRHGPRRGR